eukprot:6005428-Pleurochrysis_carterae.AAC.1
MSCDRTKVLPVNGTCKPRKPTRRSALARKGERAARRGAARRFRAIARACARLRCAIPIGNEIR